MDEKQINQIEQIQARRRKLIRSKNALAKMRNKEKLEIKARKT